MFDYGSPNEAPCDQIPLSCRCAYRRDAIERIYSNESLALLGQFVEENGQ